MPVLPCSVERGEGIDEVRAALSGNTCVFVGQSGVGKSSLLNALDSDAAARVGAVRDRDGRGRHTTTASALYDLAGGIRVIDTPGHPQVQRRGRRPGGHRRRIHRVRAARRRLPLPRLHARARARLRRAPRRRRRRDPAQPLRELSQAARRRRRLARGGWRRRASGRCRSAGRRRRCAPPRTLRGPADARRIRRPSGLRTRPAPYPARRWFLRLATSSPSGGSRHFAFARFAFTKSQFTSLSKKVCTYTGRRFW